MPFSSRLLEISIFKFQEKRRIHRCITISKKAEREYNNSERTRTLEELSEKLNITDRQLRRIEKGESGGSIDLLAEIAVMFNVSLDYLIMGRVLTTSDAKIALQEAIRVLSDLEQQL